MRLFALTDLAEDTIGKLEQEGVRVEPQDVLCLQAFSLKASGAVELLKGRPRSVGGETFWPLTIGAACWYGRFLAWLEERGRDKSPLAFFALCYASAHARSRIDCEGEEAEKAIRKWRGSLRFTEAELLDAISCTVAETAGMLPDDDTEIHGGDFDREDMAVMLVALCGGDYEAWRWVADIEAARRILAQALAIRAVTQGARQPGKADELEGLRQLCEYANRMRQRHAGAAAPEGKSDGEKN